MSVFHNNALIGSGAAAAAAGGAAENNRSVRFHRTGPLNGTQAGHLKGFTPSSAGNRKKYTFAAWVKRTQFGDTYLLFSAGTGAFGVDHIKFNYEKLELLSYDSSLQWKYVTTAVFRDPSAWYHVTCAVDTTLSTAADRVKIYVNGTRIEDFDTSTAPSQNYEGFYNSTNEHAVGYDVGNVGYTFAGYMADVFFIDGSALSPVNNFIELDSNGVYQKRDYSGTFGTNGFHLLDFANESTVGHDSSGNNNDFTANNITTGPEKATGYVSGTGTPANASGSGGWDQAFDGSTSTLVYNSNGSTTTTFNLHQSLAWTSKIRIYAGQNGTSGTNIIANGTNLSSSHTWPLSGGWQEVTSSLTSPLTSLGLTSVGGQSSNIRAIEIDDTIVVQVKGEDIDVLFDYPANGDTANDSGAGGQVNGNYATLNRIAPHGLTLSNGNLDGSGSVVQGHAPSTIFASSGKFYCEFTLTTYQNDTGVGVAASIADPDEDWIGEQAYMIGYLADGRIFQNSSSTSYSSYAAGDVIGAAFDVATGKVWFHKNGTYQNSGNPAAGTGQVGTITGGYALGFTFRSVGGAGSFNFGQRAFAYSAPSGFKALCTTNLPTPTIAQGKDYFNAVTYTGTGSNPRAVTGVGHSSDFVWIKARNAAAGHAIMDSVRGTGTNALASHTSGAEGSETYGQMSSFDSDGFTVTFSANGEQNVNFNNRTYVAWSWDAGSSTVTNTDGTITSSVRANQTAGFSIVKWTGTATAGTVGHGLGARPDLLIVKNYGESADWMVWHGSFGNGNTGQHISLNSSAVKGSPSRDLWNTTTHTNTLIHVGSDGHVNSSGKGIIAYCFSAVAGYSAFGEFDATQPFVWLGFAPKFLILKDIDVAEDWCIYDSARFPYNANDTRLETNTADAEVSASTIEIDFLSNGFKIKGSGSTINGHVIYIAFASHPFQANGGLAR